MSMEEEERTFTAGQAEAFEALRSGRNVFLSGNAGTGKSYVLNAFIEDTQKYVSGEIRMVLHGGRAVVNGRRSDSSLYDYNLATYDSGDSFDQKSSNGFIDIYGLPSRVAAARDVKFGNGIEVPKNTVE